MLHGVLRKAAVCAGTALLAVGLGLPVFALPPTGDNSSVLMPVMLGLLGLSAVLIVIYLLLSAKKKKGR